MRGAGAARAAVAVRYDPLTGYGWLRRDAADPPRRYDAWARRRPARPAAPVR